MRLYFRLRVKLSMQKYTRTTFSIILVIIMTILFHYLGWLVTIETSIMKIIQPGSSALYSWSIESDGEIESFKSVSELEDAYGKLKNDYVNQLVDRARLMVLEEENISLREQLSFFSNRSFDYTGATVVGKNVDPIGSTIIIDKGMEDNVRDGNAVILDEGIFLGKIAESQEGNSVVRLINDSQSRIAATVLNSDKSIGIVEGGFGLSVRMSFIPQHEEINIGDIIVTSGLEDLLPYGLLIGTVESVEKEAYEPFQRAIIVPPKSLEKIRIVSVLTNVDL